MATPALGQNEYRNLLPGPGGTEAVKHEEGLKELLQRNASELQLCLAILNKKDATYHGSAEAKSGPITLNWTANRSAPGSVKVLRSAFRYDEVETCIIKVLTDARLNDHSLKNSLQGELVFSIDCTLIARDVGWSEKAERERKCTMSWKLR